MIFVIKLNFLIKRLVNLKLKGRHTISDHLIDFQDIVNQYVVYFEACFGQRVVDVISLELFTRQLKIVVAIVNSSLGGRLSLNTTKDYLFSEEAHKRK